nr:hypothetical protein [uncultured Rhodoferax sp.]
MTWARLFAVNMDVRDGKSLEMKLALLTNTEKYEATGIWQKYVDGLARPFRKWVPYPKAPLVGITAAIWPEVRAWFYTPAWYLLEKKEYLPSQIAACIALLPRSYREILIPDPDKHSPAGLVLRELWPDLIYELAYPVTPWALGALACAFRRAELAGQLAVYRRAAVGIVWVLDQLMPTLDPWVQEPLLRLRSRVVQMIDAAVYPGGLMLRFSTADLKSFSRGVDEVRKRRKAPFNLDAELEKIKADNTK